MRAALENRRMEALTGYRETTLEISIWNSRSICVILFASNNGRLSIFIYIYRGMRLVASAFLQTVSLPFHVYTYIYVYKYCPVVCSSLFSKGYCPLKREEENSNILRHFVSNLLYTFTFHDHRSQFDFYDSKPWWTQTRKYRK